MTQQATPQPPSTQEQRPGSQSDGLRKLQDLVNGIRIAMIATVDETGRIHSRPMATQESEIDGALWFFTGLDTEKTREIEPNPVVNVAYADPDDARFVSVSGRATIVRDRERIHKLWNPILRSWFPSGPEDPNLVLIRIDPDEAEYWDAPSSRLVRMAGLLRAAVTGTPYSQGENRTLDLGDTPAERGAA